MSRLTTVAAPIAETTRLFDSITEGLAANERVKYFLTLLQAASAHAGQPLVPAMDLRAAREASGVTDASLDDLPSAARRLSDGVSLAPGAARIRERLFADIARMIDPLRVASAAQPERGSRADTYARRLDALTAAVPSWSGDRLETRAVGALADAGDEQHDTVHRLVMDLHRELNGLVASLAIESIEGARVLAVTPPNRALIAAFMKGVNGTAPLKFDHPGLGTTAEGSGDSLSIQNDLGTTQGHVVVVRVTGLTATLTYADVHHKRVRFLQDMLRPYTIDWQEGPPVREGQIETIVGRLTAAGQAELEQFLTSLGSRLVFLIDWNRARKQIRRFLPNADAVEVLRWAAANDIGHRAFLQAGGAQLIRTAFERIAPARAQYGARLDELIGRDGAGRLLKSILRIAADGLRQGQSVRLIQDQVEAELLCHLETPARQVLDAVCEHAMLISALAERVGTAVHASGSGHDEVTRVARLAKSWEARADDIVQRSSRTLDRSAAGRILKCLLAQADEVADALEESAFLLTLVPADAAAPGLEAVGRLADFVGGAAKDYIRALEYARALVPGRIQPEMEEVLVAVDRLAAAERAADAAERAARETLIAGCTGFRDLHVLSSAVRCLEDAADGLARCATTIRDYALSLRGAQA